MSHLTRRSVLRGSASLVAAGSLARPFIANAAATTAEVEEILRHCLEKNRDERFRSARDLAFALRLAIRSASLPAHDLHSRASSRSFESRPSDPRIADPRTPDYSSDPGEVSIAVLPFRNISSTAEAEYFSDGMTEEVINSISNIPALRVAARTSSFAFKGRDDDVRKIGRELGVGMVLEGSVRQSGARLRDGCLLVQAACRTPLSVPRCTGALWGAPVPCMRYGSANVGARLLAARNASAASASFCRRARMAPWSFHRTGLSCRAATARRMIFSARSRLSALTASQASSASLRARRRSFSFCFLGFMRLPRRAAAIRPVSGRGRGARSGMACSGGFRTLSGDPRRRGPGPGGSEML